MKRLNGSVLLLGALLAPGAPAQQSPRAQSLGSLPKLFSELDSLIARRDYTQAEHLVDHHLAQGEDPAVIYFEAAKAHFAHDDWRRSAGYFEKSLALNPENAEAHRLLGLDWRELHRPDAAETEMLEAAKQDPLNQINAYFAGQQLLLNGKIELALPYLYRALDSESLRCQVQQALGLAQARLGNYGLAESYYRKAIESAQAPEDRYASRVNLSILLLLGHDSARIEEGLSYAQQAGKLEPNSAAAHFLVGKALYKLGRLEEARSELERAATLNPGDSKPHFLLGRVYDQLGQHDRAENEMQIVSRIQARPGQTGMATMDPSPITPE